MEAKLISELIKIASRHGTSESIPNSKIPFLYLVRFDSAMPPLHHLAEPSLSIMLQGAKRVLLDRKVFAYQAGEALINSVELPITVHMSKATQQRPVLAVGIVLNPSMIASLVFESKKQTVATAGIKVALASENLLDAVLRLVRLLDQLDDLPILAHALEREIHWRILQSELGSVARQIGESQNHTMQIGKAITWIRANYEKTIRIEKLAKLSAMSPTSFHRHFRLATSMSPIQYQKRIRLQEARIRLMSSQSDIASVGLAVGYESPSQFSREYRREFGVSPKKDSQTYQTGNVRK